MEQIYLPHLREDLSEVIEKYKDMVFGIALTHVHNKTDADDVSQEVFLAFVKKERVYNGEEHLKAWLIRTTINCSKKLVGSTWRKKTLPLREIEDTSFKFETALENTIYSELRRLPYKYRTVLHLFYFEDMSVKEISKALNIKPGSIKVQLSRGRKLLKATITSDDCDL